jgi:hypothetical protein
MPGGANRGRRIEQISADSRQLFSGQQGERAGSAEPALPLDQARVFVPDTADDGRLRRGGVPPHGFDGLGRILGREESDQWTSMRGYHSLM